MDRTASVWCPDNHGVGQVSSERRVRVFELFWIVGSTASPSPFTGVDDSTTRATALTQSSSLMFITLTPCVARPICEMPPALVRWTIPFWEMKSRSWCSRTISAPARPPFFSVILIVRTPLVPRPLTGYSVTAVRLP